MPKGLNEVGAIWKKENEKGPYLSVSIDLDAVFELTGGATGTINAVAYPIDNERNSNAPSYRLKFYPKGGVRRAPADEPPF